MVISVVQNGVSREHLDDMITGKEGNGEVLQIGDTHIVKISPEESKTIHQVSVGIGEILCVNTIGDNEELNEMIQPVVGVFLITHDLIDCLADVNATAL